MADPIKASDLEFPEADSDQHDQEVPQRVDGSTLMFPAVEGEHAGTAVGVNTAAAAATTAAAAEDADTLTAATKPVRGAVPKPPTTLDAATRLFPPIKGDDASTQQDTVLIPPTPPRTTSSHTHPTVEPISFEPLDDEDAKEPETPTVGHHPEHEAQPAANHRRRNIVVVAVVVALAVILGGVFTWRAIAARNNHAAALEACTGKQQTVSATMETLAAQVKDSAEVAVTPDSQVADIATLNTLKSSLSSAQSIAKHADFVETACDASLSAQALRQAAVQLDTLDENARASIDKLKQDAAAVTSSKEKKTRVDLKNELTAAIDEAQDAYDAAEGTLYDETTREALAAAIDEARTTADDPNLTRQAVDDAKKKLEDAVTAMQDAQVEEANAAAAAAAAAAAQQAQQQAQAQQQQQAITPGTVDNGTTTNNVVPNPPNDNAVQNQSNDAGAGTDMSTDTDANPGQ
ncbi:hypothetical protein [Bifidobacterium cuniculi]|uniref:Putative peptidase C14, caspase catalytic subunit p20 n=1 Tax=Bifidobacterium cuniculi TaxID=1688 RepID=A0A087ADI5_9BIFI|nr:hypothetical protein [Bifidobacterium cuniculi]KFI56835.1 putative peptidase C14, caspase catalytic subunit p20 [Bifidobacterium cuniculi]